MPMGILQSRSLDHVPGTTRYFDDPERPQIATDADAAAAGLKCDRSGPVPIILVPQPSDDPNDPLNWPLWRRDLITFILSMTAIFATSLGSILASNTMVMTALFTTTFTKVALMTGYFLLGVGGAAVFFVPSARVWGKRHALIIGLVFLIFSSAWGGAARDSRGRGFYDSFVAARAVQGIGVAPYETLVNAAVSDLYFVHQRGLRMAFTNLAVFGGAFFTPIVVGKITHEIGWWWSFNLISIFCAVCLPAVFFFCPEMAYRRDAALNTDLAAAGVRQAGETADGEQQKSSSSAELRVSEGTEKAPNTPPGQPQSQSAEPENTAPEAVPVVGDGGPTAGSETRAASGTVFRDLFVYTRPTTDGIPAKKTFLQSLALVDGRKTDDAYWRLLLRPFALLFHPAFLWACLTQGTMIGWTVFIGAIIASIFSAPPYFWDEVKNGYSYTGPFLGALAGFGLAGLLADWSAKFMTRRNGGVYEPEFRIVLVAPMAVLGCAGLYGFGITASQLITGRYHWSVPVAFFGLQVAGMVVGTVSSSLYIVDAYRDLAIEGFTMMIIFKNFFSFVLTFYAFDWVTTGLGIRDTMTIIASIQVAVCLTSIPMYIYGKKMRALSHRRDLLRALNLR